MIALALLTLSLVCFLLGFYQGRRRLRCVAEKAYRRGFAEGNRAAWKAAEADAEPLGFSADDALIVARIPSKATAPVVVAQAYCNCPRGYWNVLMGLPPLPHRPDCPNAARDIVTELE